MKSILGLALVFGMQLAEAQNLLVNGDFETPQTAPHLNYNYEGGQAFPGWEVRGPLGNAVTVLHTTYFEANVGFNAQSGFSSVDLTGAGNVGPSAGVAQVLSTTAGVSYEIGFWLGNADGSGNQAFTLPSAVALALNGQEVETFTNPDVSFHAVNWRHFTHRFTAQAALTEIAFFNRTPTGDYYAGLDNVSVTAVPELPAQVLLLAGLAPMLLGWRAARR